jgi:hypothetical protein
MAFPKTLMASSIATANKSDPEKLFYKEKKMKHTIMKVRNSIGTLCFTLIIVAATHANAFAAPLSDSNLEIAAALTANSDKIPQVPSFFSPTVGDVKCVSGSFEGGVLNTEFAFELHDVENTQISFLAPVEGNLDIIPVGEVGCPSAPQFLRTEETHLLDALMRSKSALDLARAAGFGEIINADGNETPDRRDYRIEIGQEVCGMGGCETTDLGTISISVTFLPPTATEQVVSHFTPSGRQ